MVDKSNITPQGATHRYDHGSEADWYRETSAGLYRWQQGSWCASVHKEIKALVDSCPLGKLTPLAMEQSEPVEDDLTWLARNVHHWHEDGARLGVVGRENGYPDPRFPLSTDVDHGFTREQWLTRRADLQNKPSWGTAPEWANYLSQNESGVWVWYVVKPSTNRTGWGSSAEQEVTLSSGAVLGDWRDTLERRPIGISQVTLDQFNKSADDCFKESVRQLCDDLNAKCDSVGRGAVMDADTGWHERGDLPPVGTKCEYRLSPISPWYLCEIKYVIHDDGVVMMREDGFEQFCSINSKCQPVSFRPISTERHDLLEIITANLSGTAGQVADAILASGFKRGDA